MKTIYKYNIPAEEVALIEAPSGARFVDIQIQDEHPRLWLEVDTDKHMITHTLITVGTGMQMDHLYATFNELTHLASVQQGPFIWHFFTPRGQGLAR